MEMYRTGTGQVIQVHPEGTCSGEYCVIHKPMPGIGSDWPTHWRGDGLFDLLRLMERICPTHGVGHPAREQYGFWIENGLFSTMSRHGGCECCQEYCYGGLRE